MESFNLLLTSGHLSSGTYGKLGNGYAVCVDEGSFSLMLLINDIDIAAWLLDF